MRCEGGGAVPKGTGALEILEASGCAMGTPAVGNCNCPTQVDQQLSLS